jgi:hypothetical protein
MLEPLIPGASQQRVRGSSPLSSTHITAGQTGPPARLTASSGARIGSRAQTCPKLSELSTPGLPL